MKIHSIFFFSSRRRHTRFDCDWSSDVCSSDLLGGELYKDALWALCALPGCGPEIAEAFLRKYGTLSAVIHALAQPDDPGKNGVAPENVMVNGKRIGKARASKMQAAVTASF